MKRYVAQLLVLAVCWSSPAWAVVSPSYLNSNATPIKFADSAQTPTAVLTMTGAQVTAGTGRISGRYDRGAGAQPALYYWTCTMSLTGTNVVGEVVEWYVAYSDGTNPDGQLGTADAALTTNKRNNLHLAGLTIVDQTTTNTNMTASGYVFIPSRYVQWATWNGTTLPFQSQTNVHFCLLYPLWWEQQ
jgi:hypothetical protein